MKHDRIYIADLIGITMPPRPKVWDVFPPFRMWPGKTFFGLDKNRAHCFTVPARENTSDYVQHFELSEGNLQTKIWFLIYGIEYPAEVRYIRQKSGRDVIQFQWKKWPITQTTLREHLQQAYDSLRSEGEPPQQTAVIHHLGENLFLIRFEHYTRIQHRRDIDSIE